MYNIHETLKMKKILILILTFLPLTLLGQHLKCCESEKEVESYLSGKWKQKSDSNTEIIYTFENGKGRIKYIQLHAIDGITIEDYKEVAEISKHENGFKIKFVNNNSDVIYTRTSELKYLDSKKLILITDGRETEYYKIEE